MAFDLHPILDKYASPRPGLWYAVAPDGAPAARVGATAIQARDVGSVLLCAGAAPEGAFSDLHQLKIDSGKLCNQKRAAQLFLHCAHAHWIPPLCMSIGLYTLHICANNFFHRVYQLESSTFSLSPSSLRTHTGDNSWWRSDGVCRSTGEWPPWRYVDIRWRSLIG